MSVDTNLHHPLCSVIKQRNLTIGNWVQMEIELPQGSNEQCNSISCTRLAEVSDLDCHAPSHQHASLVAMVPPPLAV